jgi:UDP-N-acetylmuramoyl-tripeptide--D-alanyl-D-alanine ligase
MIKATLFEVAAATNGVTRAQEVSFTGVSTDTRTIVPGQLFIPIVGEQFDGHEFISIALHKGAAAFLWQHDRGQPPAGPCVIVENTLTGLHQLAAYYRTQITARFVGVTGSNGKTTTKEMIAAVLATKFKVHKSQGNYNNHIGLPLTLLSIPQDTEIVVLEMGMSGRGEIALLTHIAKPDVAVITNIGEAHLLQLGSREEIVQAKLEISQGIVQGGLLIIPGDESLLQKYIPTLTNLQQVRLIRFGEQPNNDYMLESVQVMTESTNFKWQGSSLTYVIPMLGKHNALNALAAIAVGRAFALRDESIAAGLAQLQTTGMRLEPVLGPHGSVIWNDAYNANPTSVRAALQLLFATQGYRHKYAVLGDMLELGSEEAELHRSVGRMIDANQLDGLITIGPLGRFIAEGALLKLDPHRIAMFHSKQEAIEYLLERVGSGDLILFKASRGMKFETMIEQIRTSP